jgi:carboxylesterase
MDDYARPFLLNGTNGEAVLLVHSFTGTPAQVRPLADSLNQEGYTAVGVLLAGHGTAVEDLASVDSSDWLSSVRSAAKQLDSPTKLHLVGFAMGGLLCLQLASDLDADSIVLVNAPLRFGALKTYLAPIAGIVRPYNYWPEMVAAPDDDYAEFRVQYRGYPMKALTQFIGLSVSTRRHLKTVRSPALIVQTKDDHDTHPSSAEVFARRIPARTEVLWLDGSDHNPLLGEHAKGTARRIADFLRQIA